MSTLANDLYPLLVSELPPPPAAQPSRVARRRQLRRLDQLLKETTGQELSDLIAQVRAQRTVTRTSS